MQPNATLISMCILTAVYGPIFREMGILRMPPPTCITFARVIHCSSHFFNNSQIVPVYPRCGEIAIYMILPLCVKKHIESAALIFSIPIFLNVRKFSLLFIVV